MPCYSLTEIIIINDVADGGGGGGEGCSTTVVAFEEIDWLMNQNFWGN